MKTTIHNSLVAALVCLIAVAGQSVSAGTSSSHGGAHHGFSGGSSHMGSHNHSASSHGSMSSHHSHANHTHAGSHTSSSHSAGHGNHQALHPHNHSKSASGHTHANGHKPAVASMQKHNHSNTSSRPHTLAHHNSPHHKPFGNNKAPHGHGKNSLSLANHSKGDHGWSGRNVGNISPYFGKHSFVNVYCGPGGYPGKIRFPQWSSWVDWCWTYPTLHGTREVLFQPIVDAEVLSSCSWSSADWQDLPEASCGTWVDVPAVDAQEGLDLQLMAVRFVDPGHPQKKLGPRYRVWLRNNSSVDIDEAFNVRLMACNSDEPEPGMPQAGVRVRSIEAGQMQTVDIRLPYTAYEIGQDENGQPAPFTTLHVRVDSDEEIDELDESNNGAAIVRDEVLPVDPVLFALSRINTPAGSIVSLSGEGLGPEGGQVVLRIDGNDFQAEIGGWCDLGVRVKLPALSLTETTVAEIVVIRGDGAESNELNVNISPAAPAPIGQLGMAR